MFSTFSPEVWVLILLVGVSYVLCIFSPVFYSAFVAYRRKPVMPRRLLFIATATALCYGALSFLGFALELPVEAYLVYIAPQLEAAGHYSGKPFTAIGEFVAMYWWLLLGPILLVMSIVVVRYLASRWIRIVEALRS
jgi:hypothetical protein